MASLLETLAPELFTHVLSFVNPQDLYTLNSLTKASHTLYRLVVPALYRSFSYHGMQQDTSHLRRFLDTLNWRPDLAAHVIELDVREWGKCPRLEDWVEEGMSEGHYEMKEQEKEAKKKEMEKGTLMDDALIGDEGDAADVDDDTYEEDGWDEDSEDEFGLDGDEDGITSEELRFMGPLQPFNHDDCLKTECKNSIDVSLRKEARDLGFERENTLLDHWKIWNEEESNDRFSEDIQNELPILLLSKCQNVRTMYMVLPEVHFEYRYETNPFCQFLERNSTLATSGVLQKLETLYICSPLHLGGSEHRHYELDFRRLFPFIRLPRLKSLYTLTAYVFWEHRNSPIDYKPLKHTSKVTTLTYDECVLDPYDVLQSLSIFQSLKSFRWTTSPSNLGYGDSFVGFQSNFGKVLSSHRDTLEHLYFDNRHPQVYYHDSTIRAGPTAIMIGSLQDYLKLRTLAIDVSSLLGHQEWQASNLPLVDLLPPNLEELVLFVEVGWERDYEDNPMVRYPVFDNIFFYPALLTMLRSASNRLPKLRKIRIKLVRDCDDFFWNVAVSEAKFEEAKVLCVHRGVKIDIGVAVACKVDDIREAGNTDVPYFQQQIRRRNPGRDY